MLLAEAVVRAFAFDWRLIERLLYYQKADLPLHQEDDDPHLLYRLKPGAELSLVKTGRYYIHINSEGARGPERPAGKPPGVYRVLCFGGSNVYGMGLSDHLTWPAQLEKELNRHTPGRFEVWNFGTPGYVALQMATLARPVVERLQPDLVIFALSNGGAPPLLWGQPPRRPFGRDAELHALLLPRGCPALPPGLGYGAKLFFTRHSALLRLANNYLAWRRGCEWVGSEGHEERNIQATRDFLTWAEGRTRTMVFLFPGATLFWQRYVQDTGVPVFSLVREGLPEEYRKIHPAPEVYQWYAREMAAWLFAQSWFMTRATSAK